MRYIYACFKGYIGFYSGLGLDKVEIDFTKCKNRIILISGINGCGKSTLMNALNPFPDSSSSFVPNMDAEKILQLFHEGDTYNLHIVSPTDTKGGRKTNKAYISKNGLELNPNGNVTTYKEIIFSEFDLDSNYISLTQLSSSDRGLGDKTPADRKKFVANIIENLETYNELYKTLNKKSLIFKSHINTLHTKIQNIGSKENIEMTLNSLKQKSEAISGTIMGLNNKIVELETRTSINQEEAAKIQQLEEKKNQLQSKIDELNAKIKIFIRNTKVQLKDLMKKINTDNEILAKYKIELEKYNTLWIAESEKMSSLSSSINELKANIDMYSGDIDYTLEQRYNESKNRINSILKDISKLGIQPDISLIFKLSNLIGFYDKFIRKIDVFYDGMTNENLSYVINSYNSDTDIISVIQTTIDDLMGKIKTCDLELLELRQKLKSLAILENRPNECKIDICPFISEALNIKSSLGSTDILERIEELQKLQMECSDKISEYQKDIERYSFCNHKRKELDGIIEFINDYIEELSLFGDIILSDINKFNEAILSNSYFNDQRNPERLICALNSLKEYESEKKIFDILQVEYNSLMDKISLKDNMSKSLEKAEHDIKIISENVSEYRKKKESFSSLCSNLESQLIILEQYRDTASEKMNIETEFVWIKGQIDEIQSKSTDSAQSIIKINEMRNEISRLTTESNPIIIEIQKLTGELTLLNSYYQEYELYKTKFDMIETLKKYCSPTAGGIQTIFMQLYMSKTLELSNQILSLLFGGEYKLLDFVINQNEFRIPFIGSGLAVDDISSGSTSQICIMGVAINLALFYQASTKFNIARLDEIDSGLDTRNRFGFFNFIAQVIDILQIEQLFTISHSIEADTSMVDIIKLKSYSDFEENVQLGNVIYDYNEEIKKNNMEV